MRKDPARLRLSVEARSGMRIAGESQTEQTKGGFREGEVIPLTQAEWWDRMKTLATEGGFCDIPPRS